LASQLIDPKQLKRVRTQLGYTQAALASAAGVSQSVIAKLEAGTVDPTFGTLSAISRALNSGIVRTGKRAVDVMTAPVISVQDSAKLSECVAVMKKGSISQMPVFSGRKMVGTITESQIMTLVSESAEPATILEHSVKEHALPAFAVVGTDTPVEALLSVFRFLPAVLVASGDEIVGIITKIDVLAGT